MGIQNERGAFPIPLALRERRKGFYTSVSSPREKKNNNERRKRGRRGERTTKGSPKKERISSNSRRETYLSSRALGGGEKGENGFLSEGLGV